jgi:hypothetical protein
MKTSIFYTVVFIGFIQACSGVDNSKDNAQLASQPSEQKPEQKLNDPKATQSEALKEVNAVRMASQDSECKGYVAAKDAAEEKQFFCLTPSDGNSKPYQLINSAACSDGFAAIVGKETIGICI